MKKRVLFAGLVLLLVLGLAGCSTRGNRGSSPEEADVGLPDGGPVDSGGAADASQAELGPADAGLVVEQLGRFELLHAFPSLILGNSRAVRIFLPRSYGQDPTQRYPVLYMHDGQNLFDPAAASFGMEWEVDETVDALVAAGKLPELIVVGPDCTDARIEEYTPTADPAHGGGRAAQYARFLIEELKPYIDSHYATLTDAAHTGVMGSSLGGVVSFYLGWRHPEVFSRAGCVSSAFWWDDNEALRTLRAYQGELPPTRFWVDSGTEEGEGYLETLHAMWTELQARGYVFGQGLGCQEAYGALHNETAWARRLANPLLFLFGTDPAPALEALQLIPHGDRLGLAGTTSLMVQVDARYASGLVMTVPLSLVQLSSGDEAIATVTPEGLVTAQAVGQVELHAAFQGLTASTTLQVVAELLPIQVTFVLDTTGTDVALDTHSTIADPPPPAGQGQVFIVGGRTELGDWTPNQIPLHDDGETGGDETAGDNHWTLRLHLPLGTPLLYKYTIGHPGQSWSGTEEYPLTNRAVTVQDEDGDGQMVLRDVFADRPEPTNTLPARSVFVNP